MKFKEIIKAMDGKDYELFISLFDSISKEEETLKEFKNNETIKKKLICFVLSMYLKENSYYNNFIKEHRILFLALDYWHSYLKSLRMPAGQSNSYSKNREKRYKYKCGIGQCFSW